MYRKRVLLWILALCLMLAAPLAGHAAKAKNVAKVRISGGASQMYVGDTRTLKAVLSPKDAKASVTWSSSKSSVAKVSQSGKVTAQKTGKATIKAAAGGKSASLQIKVVKRKAKTRALLIGNAQYPEQAGKLNAPSHDAELMQTVLSSARIGGAKPKIAKKLNLTRRQMDQAIDQTFSGARPEDVSIFYFSGHGGYSPQRNDSFLVGTDKQASSQALYMMRDLRARLNQIPGTVVVILDACNSGGFITKGAGGQAFAFNGGVLQAFGSTGKGISPSDGKFKVLTACADNQLTKEFKASFTVGGKKTQMISSVFTRALAEGSGRKLPARLTKSSFVADANRDKKITLREMHSHSQKGVSAIVDWLKRKTGKHIAPFDVQAFPPNSGFVLLDYR